MDKPRIRVPAVMGGALGPTTFRTADAYQNFPSNVGSEGSNLASAGQYIFGQFISRDHVQLEAAYRSSWIIGVAVDAIAEDMTRAGASISDDMDADTVKALDAVFRQWRVWHRLCQTIKWARLYGGAIAVLMIDGQDPATPLDLDSVGRGQFKGLMVLDRWMVWPSVDDLVTELGPHYMTPRYYTTITTNNALGQFRVHHTRVLKFTGIELPFWQSMAENYWGNSIVERIYDRLLAFDSTTQGAAQLVFRAWLRTYKIPGLRSIITAGGPMLQAFRAHMNEIQRSQHIEGMTVLDAEDTFETQQYSFGGLADVLIQFGQQISGATGIPLVRLFGQSPAGLSATGESDWRMYYDTIYSAQERDLRDPLLLTYEVAHRSALGMPLPPGFTFEFEPLWQLAPAEQASTGSNITTAVLGAYEQGVVGQKTVLRELRRQSARTQLWTTITDQEIDQADEEPPAPPTEGGAPGGAEGEPGGEGAQDDAQIPPIDEQAPREPEGEGEPRRRRWVPPLTRRAVRKLMIRSRVRRLFADARTILQGLEDVGPLRVVIETTVGTRRHFGGPPLTVAYGYIFGTSSVEGPQEAFDCFVGADDDAARVYLITLHGLTPGEDDEEKAMLRFESRGAAITAFETAYPDHDPVRDDDVRELTLARFARELDARWQQPAGKRGGEMLTAPAIGRYQGPVIPVGGLWTTTDGARVRLVPWTLRVPTWTDCATWRMLVLDAKWDEQFHPRDEEGKFAQNGTSSKTLADMLKKSGFAKHPESPLKTELYHHTSGHSVGFVNPKKNTVFAHYLHGKYQGMLNGVKGINDVLSSLGAAPAPKTVVKEAQAETVATVPKDLQLVLKMMEKKTVWAPAADAKGDLIDVDSLPFPAADTVFKPIPVKGLKKIGGAKGSNEGGVYRTADGEDYYVKHMDVPHAENELLAAALYATVSDDAKLLSYSQLSDQSGIATALVNLKKDHLKELTAQQTKRLRQGFAAHVWLANWDVVGLHGDNVGAMSNDGLPTLLDLGGALLYRAQGGPKGKLFNGAATEWKTMRDPGVNPQTAAVFKDATIAELQAGVDDLKKIKPGNVATIVNKIMKTMYPEQRQQLVDVLMDRRDAIVAQFEEEKKKPVQPVEKKPEQKPEPAPEKELGEPGKIQPTSAQQAAIEAYTDGHYDSMNSTLRKSFGHNSGFEEENVRQLGEFLRQNPLPEPMTVTRRVSDDFAKMIQEEYSKAGDWLVDYGFTSTSTKQNAWNGSVTLHIHLPKGAHAVDVKRWSSHASEHEVVIQRGSRYVVTKVHGKNEFDLELVRSGSGENAVWHKKPAGDSWGVFGRLRRASLIKMNVDAEPAAQEELDDRLTWKRGDVVMGRRGESEETARAAAEAKEGDK